MAIHERAYIEEGVTLGEDVEVGPYACIYSGAVIGRETCVGPHAVLYGGARLGNACSVHAGAVIADIPQDLKFEDIQSYVEVGDRVTIREGVTIHRGTVAESKTVIGDDCYLMAFSHVAHNCIVGSGVIMANAALLGGHAVIGDHVFLSGNVGVHQFVEIGRYAMIAGNCSLTKDVPPYCITRSSTLNTVTGLNVIGLKRAGFSATQLRALKNAFRIFYREQLTVKEATERAREIADDEPAVREFIEFIHRSKRGVCRPKGSAEGLL